jgi:hypothetical protein
MRKEIRLHEIQAPTYNCNEAPVMDVNRIRELLPHRYPFQLVDKVIEIGANYIVGVKGVTVNEPFFQGHFPDHPVMPGVLIVEAMAQTGDDPNKIVDERGMRQVSDAGALQPIVDEVLANCADQAQQYRDGNQKVIGFLVGQCMKASRGKGNPKLFNELLRTSLS